jgi:NAD(P)-dependent dehydrogenase (short-subunit alcohol dehydrogenase family)
MPVALITGASRGLGRALARALAARGWALIVDARSRPDLDAIVRELANVTWIAAAAGDVTDPAHRADLAAAAADFGRLDLLVNNASTLGPSPLPALADYPLDDLARVYEVNVIAPLALVQLTLPLLRSARGTVVDVSSDAAVEPYAGWGGYGSSKAALDALSAVLAVEQPSVRIHAFDPGDMRTEMHQAAFAGEDISDRPEPESVVPALLRLVTERPPSGRYRAADLAIDLAVDAAGGSTSDARELAGTGRE